MTRGTLRARLSNLAERLEELDVQRCEECSGPLPYEGPAVLVLRHPDGREEYLREHCRSCWQLLDEHGRGKGWPSPGRWDPEHNFAPRIVLAMSQDARSAEVPT